MTKAGEPLSRAELVARVKALARKRGVRTVSRRGLEAATGISRQQMLRHFDTHGALMKACGLTPVIRRPSLPDDVLLAAMHKTFTAAGGVVSGELFNRSCRHGRKAYKSRWRSWTEALRAYRDWLRRHHPDCPHMAELNQRCQESEGPAAWKGCGGARFGAPLDRHGLQHAPINEMGVVFLFGALAPTLGYIVERLGSRFPDCLAKRRLLEPAGTWEQVRIEFEFRSRNFLRHRHDAKKCDVIVCWENDWPDCPLEVLELKREIGMPTEAPHPLAAARDLSRKGRGLAMQRPD